MFTLLLYLHITTGGITLASGLIAILSKKGSVAHKKSGKVFYWCMLTSAFIGIIITLLPNHKNPFLLAIGLFSSYFVLSSYQALRYKTSTENLIKDKLVSYSMLIIGLSMVILPVLLQNTINIILTIFGTVGAFFAFRDILLFRKPKQLKQDWLKLHLGKMMGAYIAATTAFVVANNLLPGVYGWLLPSVPGSLYITYWMNQLKR